MIQYAKSDIQDGMSLVKAGLSNIISELLNGTINQYTLEFPFEKSILIALIHYALPDITIFTEYHKNKENLRLCVGKRSIRVTYLDNGKYEFQSI